jgi:AbrB family looped-hinge helix DNA binding protein
MRARRSKVASPDRVTISPKFQVVIPQRVRETLQLKAGGQLQAMAVDGQLVFVPVRPVKSYVGILKGPNDFERDETDRF